MPSRHLVSNRDLALLRQVNFHQLNHPWRQLVRLEDLVDLVLRFLLDSRTLGISHSKGGLDALVHALGGHPKRLNIHSREIDLVQLGLVQLSAFGDVFLNRSLLEHYGDFLAVQQLTNLLEKRSADTGLLFVLQRANFANPLPSILLDNLIFDA